MLRVCHGIVVAVSIVVLCCIFNLNAKTSYQPISHCTAPLRISHFRALRPHRPFFPLVFADFSRLGNLPPPHFLCELSGKQKGPSPILLSRPLKDHFLTTRLTISPTETTEIPQNYPTFASNPIGSMYGIFTYIWLICMVNVGKCTIHGSYVNLIPQNIGPIEWPQHTTVHPHLSGEWWKSFSGVFHQAGRDFDGSTDPSFFFKKNCGRTHGTCFF